MTFEQAASTLNGDELYGETQANKLLVYPERRGGGDGTDYIVITNWPGTYWKQFFAYPHSEMIPYYLELHISCPLDTMPLYIKLSDRWMVLTLDELISYNNGERK